MKIRVRESTKCSLTEFYNRVAREIGYISVDNLIYDCRHINISSEIQGNFFEYYKELAKEKDPHISDNEVQTGTCMLLAMAGPKVDVNLKENEVEIFDNFITQREV